MKIRGRLMIAFLIMTLFPIAITLLSTQIILSRQREMLNHYYNITSENTSTIDILANPFNILHNITFEDYRRLKKVVDSNPDKLLDKKFLATENARLQKKESFLIVVENGSYFYIGSQKGLEKLSYLPLTNEYNQKYDYVTCIDHKSSCLIKEASFLFSNKTQGQFFIVTNYSKLVPRWTASIREMVIAFLIILLTTAIILVLWIYESIVRPINILRIATMQIGQGNLDTPISSTSSDEIGQLCHDFDEMRIRLKDMIEKSIASDENTREIISSISHDLKTPVTAIKGYTEGIIDGVADTPEKQKKYLQTIYAKANDITYLIDELSLFSKVERNSLAYNFIPVNLNDYFTDCISDVSLDLESKNISVEYINTTDKATNVLVDTEQLKRVIHNIIDNAAKYMDKPKGHITIRITDVEPVPAEPPLYRQIKDDGTDLIPQSPPEEFVQVEITDNGPGIDEKDLPHIFERFFRADASRNSSKRGSGIGLSIVKLIITEHGGEIWAESEKDAGSSFYFTLRKETLQDNKEIGGSYE